VRKVFFISLFISTLSVTLRAQQTPKSLYISEYLTIGYLEYLPPGYTDEDNRYPVLIFLHGGGEGGDGSPEALEKVKSWGPPSHIKNGHDMCFDVKGEKECFIVISPQINTEIYEWDYFVPIVVNYILNGADNYKIDPERIYVTGLSKGGLGTYAFAASSGNQPNKLAAIAPMSAMSNEYIDGCIISERLIPVWAFHGKKDTIIPYSLGLNAFNSIADCDDPVPTGEMIFTTYEDRYHDAWIPGYDPSHEYHEPNVYEWLLEHKLPVPPERVTGLEAASGVNNSTLAIYPNPADGLIQITTPIIRDNISFNVQILDIAGNKLLQTTSTTNGIDISSLVQGTYIVTCTGQSGIVATGRLIKR
jgi:hypothetical protein